MYSVAHKRSLNPKTITDLRFSWKPAVASQHTPDLCYQLKQCVPDPASKDQHHFAGSDVFPRIRIQSLT